MSIVMSKLNIRALVILILIVLLYTALIPEVPFRNYFDDIVPLIFVVMWIRTYPLYKIRKNHHETKVFMLLLLVCVIGVVSNFFAQITTSSLHILLDMYSFLKMFFVYLGVYAFLNNRENGRKKLIKYASGMAKIFILISFICGMLNLFGIVKMSEQVRFGYNTFCFIYTNASQYAMYVAVALAFIILEKPHKLRLYEILGLSVLIMTMKGMALIIVAVYLGLNFFHMRKIRAWHIAVIGCMLLVVLRFQVSAYLLDETAPRAILIRYGIQTANNYFPLGAGFGTYGSDIAGRHYSKLYTMYGFPARASLRYGEQTALNDAYFAMLLGQFGWGGTIITYSVFGLIGKRILRSNKDNYKGFYICMALFACICGMSVMAGSLKGPAGQLMLLVIQLFCMNNEKRRTVDGNETTAQSFAYDKVGSRGHINAHC